MNSLLPKFQCRFKVFLSSESTFSFKCIYFFKAVQWKLLGREASDTWGLKFRILVWLAYWWLFIEPWAKVNLQDHPTLLLDLALLCILKVLPCLWTLPPVHSAPCSSKLKMCLQVKWLNWERAHPKIFEWVAFWVSLC